MKSLQEYINERSNYGDANVIKLRVFDIWTDNKEKHFNSFNDFLNMIKDILPQYLSGIQFNDDWKVKNQKLTDPYKIVGRINIDYKNNPYKLEIAITKKYNVVISVYSKSSQLLSSSELQIVFNNINLK